ncbi:MAG: hypothetical protein QOE61_1970 [Micromonosporaceae bacterium]|jgi:SAM-dependent methyltransferase|nr:hypothetical protein [Micromonosporaceae bacterium]
MTSIIGKVGLVTDDCAASGEFLDVLSRDAWETLREPLAAAVCGMDPSAGPLGDLGAGSGRGTCLLAGLVPQGTVLAVEPSLVRRAVLVARVVDDPSVQARVTVVAAAAETADLPDRLGGVLAMNMIGHLPPPERRRLWRRIADRLAPDASVVLDVQPSSRAEAVPETDFASVPIGCRCDRGSERAEPEGPERIVWHMRYRVCDERGEAERELTAAYHWHVASPELIEGELMPAGFAVEHGPYGLVRASRGGR